MGNSHWGRMLAWVGIFCIVVFFQYIASAGSDMDTAIEFRQQGVMHQNQGNYKKALYFYQSALAILPENAEICNDVGLMQEFIDQNSEAEASYLKAIQLDPRYLPAYNNLGTLYSKQGKYVLAVQYLQERVNKGRADDVWTLIAQEELMKAYKHVPLAGAARIRDQAEEFSSSIVAAKNKMRRTAERNQALDFETAHQKGQEMLEVGNFDEAIDLLGTAVVINPRSQAARQALKRAQFAKEKFLLEVQAKEWHMESKSRSVSEALDNDFSR